MEQTAATVEDAVRRVLAGEVAAYADIVAAHERLVWLVVAQLLCRRDETEELVQRVFIRAYEQLDRYQPGSDFAAWLATMARNLARNHLRDRGRERDHLGMLRHHLERQFADDHAWEEEERDLLVALAACRAALDPPAQELLRLHYEEALPLSRIAERLRRSTSGVERLLARLRIVLRDCVQARAAGA